MLKGKYINQIFILVIIFSFILNAESNPENYLIVMNSSLESNAKIDEFISWKTEKGFNIIPHSVSSETSVEEIDSWIEDQYDLLSPKPKFLLIVGDADGEFGVKTQIDNFTFTFDTLCSDLVYGVVGEIAENNIIPQIYVGRFSVRSIDELEAQIDKTIWYEKNQFLVNHDLSYLQNALGEANNNENYPEFRNAVISYGWDHYFSDTFINPFTDLTTDINGTSYYAPHHDSLDIVSEVKDHIADGMGFFYYSGNSDKLKLKYPFFTIDDVNEINNQDNYPILFMGG